MVKVADWATSLPAELQRPASVKIFPTLADPAELQDGAMAHQVSIQVTV
uniref:Uncharacterized protein MANES_02G168800 n=1 Tax=Rhizophora mucronata TaxID=61149 RepID=A0A2P2L386_RHIMU